MDEAFSKGGPNMQCWPTDYESWSLHGPRSHPPVPPETFLGALDVTAGTWAQGTAVGRARRAL